MKGDFSKWDFDPHSNFSGVLHQQGRVLLDRDWNAATFIESTRRQQLGADTIGTGVVAVPADAPDSFLLKTVKKNGDVTVELEAGRCWVDGIHVLAKGPGPLSRTATYYDSSLTTAGIADDDRDAVILEVWEETISGFQVPEALMEPALGGPDTTMRKKVCWALRLLRLSPDEDCGDLGPRLASIKSAGKLTVEPSASITITGDCPIEAGGGYTGFEHYLYRVEIAKPNGGARFKWSRFNGGLVGRGTYDSVKKEVSITANAQAINVCGLSKFYLEGLDENAEGCWEVVFRAEAEKIADNTLKITNVEAGSTWSSTGFFRLWDGVKPIADFTGTAKELENGLQLLFSSSAEDDYLVGDHWDFAVRATGTKNDFTAWPNDAEPEGVKYRRAPLGIVRWQAAVPDGVIEADCRVIFRPLTRLEDCCTFTVGDGKHSHGDFDSIEVALANLPDRGGKICVLQGTHEANAIIIKDNVTIRGCGPGTVVVPRETRKIDSVFVVFGAHHCTIEHMTIRASDTGNGVLAIPNSAEREPEYLVLDALGITATAESAIRVREASHVRITNCAISMRNVASGRAGMFVLGNDVLIEHNRVTVTIDDPAPQKGTTPDFVGRGGIQIGGTSHCVSIIDNRIQFGIGNGITLGSLYSRDTKGNVDINHGWVIKISNLCDPCAPASVYIPPNGTAEDPDRTYHSEGTLYHVRIERNEIKSMGMNGIGVVGFFDLSAQDEFISVEGCQIIGNSIEDCLLRPVEPEDDLEDSMGYGAIALADVEALVIHDNSLIDNGKSSLEPICGVYVLHGEGVDIHRNRIVNNGAQLSRDVDSAKKGSRAGIHIQYAIPPTIPISVTVLSQVGATHLRQDGVPAARIHDNIVSQPLGHAVFVVAVGPVSVQGNQLTTQGASTNLGASHALASTVFIANLGFSNEVYLQVLFKGFISALKTSNYLKTSSTGFVREGLDDLLPGTFLANGNVLFKANQIVTDLLAAGTSYALTSTFILSLDDVAFQDNQSDCSLGLRAQQGSVGPEDVIVINALIFGMSVRVSDNRFKESLIGTFFSAFTVGLLMNHTTDNQATHCLYYLGNQIQSTGNKILIDPTGKGICSGFSQNTLVMNEKYTHLKRK